MNFVAFFVLNWAAFTTRFCRCLEKDNNNRCNYLQHRKKLVAFYLTLRTNLCSAKLRFMALRWVLKNDFDVEANVKNVPRHFCASCDFLSSIIKKSAQLSWDFSRLANQPNEKERKSQQTNKKFNFNWTLETFIFLFKCESTSNWGFRYINKNGIWNVSRPKCWWMAASHVQSQT